MEDVELEKNELADSEQDEHYVDQQLKTVTQELIKYGILEKVHKPNYYQSCLSNRAEINQFL